MKNLSFEELKTNAEELTTDQQAEIKGGYVGTEDVVGF